MKDKHLKDNDAIGIIVNNLTIGLVKIANTSGIKKLDVTTTIEWNAADWTCTVTLTKKDKP